MRWIMVLRNVIDSVEIESWKIFATPEILVTPRKTKQQHEICLFHDTHCMYNKQDVPEDCDADRLIWSDYVIISFINTSWKV